MMAMELVSKGWRSRRNRAEKNHQTLLVEQRRITQAMKIETKWIGIKESKWNLEKTVEGLELTNTTHLTKLKAGIQVWQRLRPIPKCSTRPMALAQGSPGLLDRLTSMDRMLKLDKVWELVSSLISKSSLEIIAQLDTRRSMIIWANLIDLLEMMSSK